ncbi:MAG: hypothetical protein DI537_10255 [Stutzerimonas stutzeri]|nr:MAG: hypothetical protein DI537_10255 [Stutzerimonas stutzeri]
MKYLMYDVGGSPRPFLFAADMAHADIHKMVGGGFELISAGFVSAHNCAPRAHGVSTTLNVRSRPEDTAIMRQHLGWET